MANIFVYDGVGIAAGALPDQRAPNLTQILCISQEDERLATRLNEQQLRQLTTEYLLQTEYLKTNRLQFLTWRSIQNLVLNSVSNRV